MTNLYFVRNQRGKTLGSPQDSIDIRSRDQEWVALIKRVADGDQSALTTLYDSTSRLVFGLILRVLGDRATAEEVLLDVFTQVWRQAALYDRSRGAPLAWLLTIARSRAIDRLQSGKHDQQHRQHAVDRALQQESSCDGSRSRKSGERAQTVPNAGRESDDSARTEAESTQSVHHEPPTRDNSN